MKDKFNIHRDSELWDYVGKVEVTQELVDFFEEERKRKKRENQSEFRHIAFEIIDDENIYSSITNKPISTSEQVEINILLEQAYDAINSLTEIEKRRFILNKIVGLTALEIANLEKVSIKRIEKSIANAKKKIMQYKNF